MNARVVAPGSTLAGRYRIEDLVGESVGSRTWRAFDSVLNRSVGVQVLAADDARCAAFLAAARRSTVVTDPRFLRVLDCAENEDGIAYTVREWARTVPLSVVLAEGPLPNRQAASLVTEVAEAMASAHEAGVHHRRLDLSTVHVKDTGAVRISCLATDHVLRSEERVPTQRTGVDTGETPLPADAVSATAAQYAAERSDVRAIGRILYACLVARWPGSRDTELPPAPTEHGRLLRPRQVRAGVSRDIDTVVDRILGTPPRHHLMPLVTARDVATELALVGEDEMLLDDTSSSAVDLAAVTGHGMGATTLDPPPALLPASRPRATPLPPAGEPPEAGASRRAALSAVRTHRRLLGVGLVLLVLLAASLAFAVGRQSARNNVSADLPTPPGAGTPGTRANADLVTLDVRSVTDFDPQGTDGGENPQTAELVADGDPRTAWTTLQYQVSPELGNLKDGVGVLVDLGQDRMIGSYDVLFAGAPTKFELYAAPPGTDEPPTSIEELGEPFERNTADNDPNRPTRRVELRPPVMTRYVVLWLTSLPEEQPGSGTYRGEVRELRLVGAVR